jgi:hypothetical protein
MKMTNKINQFFVLGFTLLLLSNLFFITGQASVGLVRKENEFAKNSKNGWFVYSLNPGDTINDTAILTNITGTDINVDILGRDAEITSDGVYTVIDNSLENKSSGSWIKLDSNVITVPASKTIEVPFKVIVPLGTPSGEYGTGLTILPKDSGIVQGGGNVSIKTRNAVRMYVTVKGDLKLDSAVGGLDIIEPSDENYNSERNRRGYIGRDNIVAKFTAKNTGNVYSNLEADYILTLPDGEKLEGKMNSLIAPGVGDRSFYIRTDKPFAVGQIELEIRYKISPLNEINSGQTVNANVEGVLKDSVNITQEVFDNFGFSRKKAVEELAEEEKKGGIRTVVFKEESSTLSNRDRILIGLAVFLLLVIILFQVYNIIKRKK